MVVQQLSLPFGPHVFAPLPATRQLGGSAQTEPMQLRWKQSAASTHAFPTSQRGVVAPLPPQSMSVSAPFFTASVGEGIWQTSSLQTPLVQSVVPLAQPFPSSHFGAAPPPQSTSVSV